MNKSFNSKYSTDNLLVILPIGGKATRLLPLTEDISKPLIPLFNKPLIDSLLFSLSKQGLKNFILGTQGYVNSIDLYDHLKFGEEFSLKHNIDPKISVKYQPRGNDVGSADSLRILLNTYDASDHLLVVQPDNIFNVNLQDLIQFHEQKQSFMTIALTSVSDTKNYGVAIIDDDNRINSFIEKPTQSDYHSNLINTGIYLINSDIKEVFKEKTLQEKISSGRLDFGLDLIPHLVNTNRDVYGYLMPGKWFDLGTPSNYLNSSLSLLATDIDRMGINGHVPGSKNLWIQSHDSHSLIIRNKILKMIKSNHINLKESVLLGSNCSIDHNSSISHSTIGDYSMIGKNVVISNSIIMDHTIIEDGSQIDGSIIGRHSLIRSSDNKSTQINDLSVIGNNVTILNGCKINSTQIYPNVTIPENQVLFNRIIQSSEVL